LTIKNTATVRRTSPAMAQMRFFMLNLNIFLPPREEVKICCSYFHCTRYL
jgi:hypothetical protein